MNNWLEVLKLLGKKLEAFFRTTDVEVESGAIFGHFEILQVRQATGAMDWSVCIISRFRATAEGLFESTSSADAIIPYSASCFVIVLQ
ncbi:unnamed protein product [Clavelina lepadiformis]|uniref:Uncharacterized protein n=1 Tax=Clavelina lepadiformis TaxID=159417 RepID=A0ABP0F019_CLALP